TWFSPDWGTNQGPIRAHPHSADARLSSTIEIMNTTPESSGPGAENGRPETGHQIFSWIRTTGLYRPDGAWVGGIFAAAADKLNWDRALVRGLGIVAFILFTSPSMLFYGLAWLFLPDARGHIHAQQALRGSYPSGLWGAR